MIRAFELFVAIRNKSSFTSNFQFQSDADEAGIDINTDMEKPVKIDGGWKWKTKVGTLYEEYGKMRFEPFKESVTGTKEWAKYNYNIQTGCEHDCAYCYAKAMAVRFSRVKADGWDDVTISLKAVSKKWKKRDGTIMFPTTHDITQANINHCLIVLDNILRAGNNVLIVSKPDPNCIRLLCDAFEMCKKQILFRFTIGSVDNQTLKFYEPDAPSFGERLAALAHAHTRGFKTSVSIEPMLDFQPYQIVKIVDEYVTDSIWLGLMNNARTRLKLNECSDQVIEMADKLRLMWSYRGVKNLYEILKDNPKIRWKDSIKKLLGLDTPQEAGLDI